MLYNQPRTAMFRGQETPIAEIARELGVPYSRVMSRCVMGRETGDDLERDPSPKKAYSELIEIDGEKRTFAEWYKLNGIPQDVASHRVRRLGWSVKKALTQPVKTKKPSASVAAADLSSCWDVASDDS